VSQTKVLVVASANLSIGKAGIVVTGAGNIEVGSLNLVFREEVTGRIHAMDIHSYPSKPISNLYFVLIHFVERLPAELCLQDIAVIVH
jgi:hypothetical protein